MPGFWLEESYLVDTKVSGSHVESPYWYWGSIGVKRWMFVERGSFISEKAGASWGNYPTPSLPTFNQGIFICLTVMILVAVMY